MSTSIKNIRKTIDEFKKTNWLPIGQVIEALLINSDDMVELKKWAQDSLYPLCDKITNEITFRGIKIVESPHAQKGVITKIFKSNYQPTGFGNFLPSSDDFIVMSGSGIVENGLDNIPIAESESFKIPNNLEPIIEENNKEKEPKKKRHSTTRKIEL